MGNFEQAVKEAAEPTTECTTCGATVVRVTGVYDYPPPGEELVRAARDALETLDGVVRGYRYLDPAEVRDALRRALAAPEAKGGGRG